jgi:hypothetical protein
MRGFGTSFARDLMKLVLQRHAFDWKKFFITKNQILSSS